MPAPDRIAVRYLFSRSCPSHEEGLALLRAAAGDAGVDLDLEVVEVTTDAQAGELGFTGSPTYLLAGADPFPHEEPAHAPAHDACRAYARPGGRIGPLPHHDDLVAAVRAAAGGDGDPS
ncbi:MAG: hypothetical protein AB7V62_13605 [Thermoleophilia bacterium]